MRFSQENRSSIYTFLRFSSSSRNTRHSRVMARAIKFTSDEGQVGQKKKTAEVDAGNVRAPWNNSWILQKKTKRNAKKKGSKKTTSRNISFIFIVCVGPVTIPVLTVWSDGQRNGNNRTSRSCCWWLGGNSQNTCRLTHSRVTTLE